MSHSDIVEAAGQWAHQNMAAITGADEFNKVSPEDWRDLQYFHLSPVRESTADARLAVNDALIALKRQGYKLDDNPLNDIRDLKANAGRSPELAAAVQDVSALFYFKEKTREDRSVPAQQKMDAQTALVAKAGELASMMGLEKDVRQIG